MRTNCSLLLLLFLVSAPARAEAPPLLVVNGDLPQSGGLSLAQIQALGPLTVPFDIHGARHTALGVPLGKVLARFGFAPGPMGKGVAPTEKRNGFRRVVVASAPDGFQAVFSGAEISPEIGATQALVVWQVDGKPLPDDTGPLRLVVPTDKEPSRALHQLRRLDVVDLRRVVTPAKP